LECPNLHEHDQKRAIAYGHTWSPCYELAQSPPMHHGHAIAVDMSFSLTWAERLGYIDSALKERVFDLFRSLGLSLMHPWFNEKTLKKGTDTIFARRDGDLYAAIPDGQIGKCRFVMVEDFLTDGISFEEGHARLDKSLEEALQAHRKYCFVEEGDRHGNGCGVGKTPYISLGLARSNCGDFCACSKLELGTWGERLVEMCKEVEESQSFEAVREKVRGIARWWDMCGEYLQDHSSPLGETALRILEEQQKKGVFPDGMSTDWALDVQSAQTLDFLAAMKTNNYASKFKLPPPPPLSGETNANGSPKSVRELKKSSSDSTWGNGMVAWDLGTLTGVSAAVLGAHFDVVETVEREPALAKFAGKHLQKNVKVNVGEIDEWLLEQKSAGKQADMIFMDLDKTAYEPLYKLIMDNGLLKCGGLLVADNVLYRGLPAELSAEGGEERLSNYEASGTISEKTRLNAEALVRFNSLVKDDVAAGSVRSIMLPVRDGMMAVMKLGDYSS